MSTTAPPVAVRPAKEPGRPRQILLASLGNAAEWFDWTVYVTFAAVLGPQFFPSGDGATNVLETLSVFAVGFLFRPVGGLLIGAYCDRRGRGAGLRLSLLLMAGGSLLIALAPAHRTAGVLSPALLVAARALQGLSAGGEGTAMSTYVIETAPRRRRGLYSSAIYISTTLGTLTATFLALLLRNTLTPDQLADWGWRIPFALGALFASYGWWMRRGVRETPAFGAVRERAHRPAGEVLRAYPRRVVRVAGFTLGATVVYYTFAAYLPLYAQVHDGVPADSALWASVAAQVVFMAALPLLGMATDRFGPRPMLLVFGGGFVCLTPVLFAVMSGSAVRLFAVMAAALLLFGCYATAAPAATSQMFPTAVRSTGVGLPYALTVALFGGTAPYLNEYLAGRGHAAWYPWYVVLLSAASTVFFLRFRGTADADLTAVEDTGRAGAGDGGTARG
ncbi:MFS transporter [Streptomyces sp. V2I9]|uniref:MFS transporter n=1 Tax=Streptomyces sp. V2I9 TaxID=3042304 RepID=UPI0027844B41|nr:MFS transporter [Streptomyces sp. V2I9]MDQ0986283.1 MHS family alpha-ketoglutarate permease-like MFS transporter [Streptomyces sp. V2I9]